MLCGGFLLGVFSGGTIRMGVDFWAVCAVDWPIFSYSFIVFVLLL